MKKIKKYLIGLVFAVFGTIKIWSAFAEKSEELEALQVINNQLNSDMGILQQQNEALLNPPKVEITVKTLKEYVAPASELITYKYYYTDVAEFEKDALIGKDRFVYAYSGVISGGIDVSDIKFAVNNDEGKEKITIAMPEPKIIAHEIDEKSFQQYKIKNSILTSESFTEFASLLGTCKTTQEDKLNSNTVFWDGVKSNTETVIKGLITADEQIRNNYEIEFNWNEN